MTNGLCPEGEHELCAVCGEAYGYPCCEVAVAADPCWACMGSGDGDYDPFWHDEVPPCRECHGCGETYTAVCLGGCRPGQPHAHPRELLRQLVKPKTDA